MKQNKISNRPKRLSPLFLLNTPRILEGLGIINRAKQNLEKMLEAIPRNRR
jgi:hypothetical protein